MGLEIGGKKIKKAGATPDYTEHLDSPKGTYLGKGTVHVGGESFPVEKMTMHEAGKGKGNLTIGKAKSGQTTSESMESFEVKSKPVTTLVDPLHLATVTVNAGQTVNLGNYESVKVSVALSLPTHVHDLDASYEFASDWVSTKMAEAVKAIKE
jgi:hypothetical protein